MKFKFFVTAILFCLFAAAAYAQPVKQHGRLKVLGTVLTDTNGQPVALHGMSFGWHNLWRRFYNAAAV